MKKIKFLCCFFIMTCFLSINAHAANPFDDFSFKSYNTYKEGDSNIDISINKYKDHTNFTIDISALRTDCYYVFKTGTIDDKNYDIKGSDDCLSNLGGVSVYNKYLYGWNSYLGCEHPWDNYEPYKNKTTDFLYGIIQADYLCELFTPLGANVSYAGNGYYLAEEFAKSIVLYEFSLGYELTNKLGVDEYSPVISGNEYYYVSDYDSPILLCEITEDIKAFDNVEGDLSSNIIYTTDYPSGNNFDGLEVKSYQVLASVSDSSGNETSFSFIIKVVDITAPVITGNKQIYIKTSDNYNTQMITDLLFVTDNYEANMKEKLQVKENTFSGNEKKVGKYYILYEAKDSSGNASTFRVDITLTDGIKPIIEGQGEIHSTKFLGEKEILSLFSATDEHDGDISSKLVVESNSCNSFKVGTYEVVISATDEAGNKATRTITYRIYDDEGPVIWVNGNIKVEASTILSMAQVKNIIIDMGKANEGDVINLTSDYFTDSKPSGEYLVIANIIKQDGTTVSDSVVLTVLKEQQAEEEDKVDVAKTKNKVSYFLVAGSGLLIISSGVIFIIRRKKK